MDALGVLGIAANVIAVVDLAAKACGVVYNFAKSAKDCPKTITQLQQELSAVQTTAEGLREIARRLEDSAKAGGEPVPLISQLSTALKECEGTLKDLVKELEGHFSNKLREKFGRRLKWPIREPEVIDLIAQLARYQKIFHEALQVDIA
jgi:siroheme synthase